jgi:DNA-binding transcriptional ArsR family regulator
MRLSSLAAFPLLLAAVLGVSVPSEQMAGSFASDVEFARAWVDGALAIEADHGAMQLRGPFELELTADRVELRRVVIGKESVNNPLAGDVSLADEQRTETSTMRSVIGRLAAHASEGLVYAFQDAGGARLGVRFSRATGEPFVPEHAPETMIVPDPGQSYSFVHELAPPMFGVSWGRLEGGYHRAPETILLGGTLDVMMDYASLEFAHDAGTTSVTTGSERSLSQGLPGFPVAYHVERSWATLHLENATVRVVQAPADFRFVSGHPRYELQGELTVPAEAGNYRGVGEGSLAGKTLQLTGAFVVHVQAGDAPRGAASPLAGSGAAAPVRGHIEGTPSKVRIDGALLALPPSEVPEGSALAVALGALALLWGTLQKVTAPLVVPLYARLVGKDLLSNRSRLAIYHQIQSNPFTHLREVKRQTGFSYGTIAYHVSLLKKERLVCSARSGREEFLFLPQGDFTQEQMRRLCSLGSEPSRRVADLLCVQGALTQAQIVARLGFHQGFVSRQLRSLQRAGLVAASDAWPRTYAPSPLLRAWTGPFPPAGKSPGVGLAGAS